MIDTILFVCEGNICRSPMAQGLLAKRLPDLSVTSAGLGALVGRSPDPVAVALMAERDIDIAGHTAVGLNLEHMRRASLVLAMTAAQCRRIEAVYPFSKGKVYRIAEYEGIDVVDPYRKGREVFEMTLVQIEQGLARWIDKMVCVTN